MTNRTCFNFLIFATNPSHLIEIRKRALVSLFTYLEGHPGSVYLSSCPGKEGCPGPDGEQRGLSSVQLQQRLGDGALVLVTGHHKVEDNEGGKAQQANHTNQGEPVHLPEKGSY